MRQDWTAEQLADAWTLEEGDRTLIGNKSGATRLGSALKLKFFQLQGRFPTYAEEIPSAAGLRRRAGRRGSSPVQQVSVERPVGEVAPQPDPAGVRHPRRHRRRGGPARPVAGRPGVPGGGRPHRTRPGRGQPVPHPEDRAPAPGADRADRGLGRAPVRGGLHRPGHRPSGSGGVLTGADREHAEISMLALHLLQSCLVHVNTLLLQRVLEDPVWAGRLTPRGPARVESAVLDPRQPVWPVRAREGQSSGPGRLGCAAGVVSWASCAARRPMR